MRLNIDLQRPCAAKHTPEINFTIYFYAISKNPPPYTRYGGGFSHYFTLNLYTVVW